MESLLTEVYGLCIFFAACSVGFYGYKCKKKCECKFLNMDKECDFRNGECYCEPGFTSEYCNQSMSYLLQSN